MDRYWIDIKTGTWGHCDDLRIVDLSTVVAESNSEPPLVPSDYVRYWQDYASDSEMAEFGERHGTKV